VTRRIQKAKAKCMENMFKGLLNENDAQTNVFRKQAKVKIARAKAKHMVQTTAKITFNSKQKFCTAISCFKLEKTFFRSDDVLRNYIG